MPHTPEAQAAFCAHLRAERERRGVSLTTIADVTKVKASLLEDLERAELARWPRGLFRRAFFREYLNAVGVPIEPTFSAFVDLFPDAANPPVTNVVVAQTEVLPALRLTLAPRDTPTSRPATDQVVATAIDAAIVLIVSGAIAWPTNISLGTTLATLAVSYYSIATLCIGRSPVLWWLRRPAVSPNAAAAPTTAATGGALDTLRGWTLRIRRATGAPFSGQVT